MDLVDLYAWLKFGLNVVIALLVLQFVGQVVYYHFFHPLSKFPGPFWGGVTRIWLAVQFYRGTEVETEKRLHEKYGT